MKITIDLGGATEAQKALFADDAIAETLGRLRSAVGDTNADFGIDICVYGQLVKHLPEYPNLKS